MNLLTLWILETKSDEGAVMHRLQGSAGVISDNCVDASDVASEDARAAVQWLNHHQAAEPGRTAAQGGQSEPAHALKPKGARP